MAKAKSLGRYEIVAELGRGAMGVVYKARDPKIDRFVALKTISLAGQEPEAEREFRERFFFEAQAAGRLVHPGIVTIFDVGEEPQRRDPYIVMEYIEGQSLSKLLSGEKKKLPFSTALRLTEELAEALDYAHAQGVVHRDMKPANILVNEEGHAKIADFGIAKLNLAHLTVPGQVLGTPAYMSPEQLEGEQVDGRSDLFSLGVILYSMITGYRPFQGNSATTVCFKVANREPVPATALDSELPPELDSVISRAMAKNPADRYQRGMEFAEDVRKLREYRLSQTSNTWVPTATSIMAAAGGKSATQSRTRGSWTGAGGATKGGERFAEIADLAGWAGANWAKLLVAAVVVTAGVVLLTSYRLTPAREDVFTGAPVAGSASVSGGAKHASRIYAGRPVASVSPAPANMILLKKRARTSSRKSAAAGYQGQASESREKAGTANLKLSVEHHFTDAKLSLFVDDKLTYTQALRASSKKRLVVFRGSVKGYDLETVPVPTGEHRLRVQVQSGASGFDHSTTIVGTFTSDAEKTLRINFDKQRNDMLVALE